MASGWQSISAGGWAHFTYLGTASGAPRPLSRRPQRSGCSHPGGAAVLAREPDPSRPHNIKQQVRWYLTKCICNISRLRPEADVREKREWAHNTDPALVRV